MGNQTQFHPNISNQVSQYLSMIADIQLIDGELFPASLSASDFTKGVRYNNKPRPILIFFLAITICHNDPCVKQPALKFSHKTQSSLVFSVLSSAV